MHVLCFGEILWDVIDGREHLGGAPMNLAGHLARLGCDVDILSRVGHDARGGAACRRLIELGVNPRLVQFDRERSTGTVDVTLTNGQPSYTIHEGVAWDFIDAEPALIERMKVHSFDALYFGTLAQRSRTSAGALREVAEALKPPVVFFDVNLRQQYFNEALIRQSLSMSTVAKLNDEEVETLSDMLQGRPSGERDFARSLSDEFGLEAVCITRGARGAAVWHGGEWHESSPPPIDVADAVGAGDAFGAAFLRAWLAKIPAPQALELANRLGAYVASRAGAIPEYDESIRRRLGEILPH